MPYYVKLTEEGFVQGVDYSETPPACSYVETETQPPAGMCFPFKWRLDGDQFVNTGQLWIEPTYQNHRAMEYPPVGDQMDALWHAMETGMLPQIEPFYSQIKAVKDKYPKPSN